MSANDSYWGGEQVVLCQDPTHGLRAVIAIDDTTLGPGLGGVRLAHYPSLAAGATEARRLAAAMTVKNALAGLPYGGAKSVIFPPERDTDRLGLMRRFGEFVARTGGSYVPGVDMGTDTNDLLAIASGGAVVSCSDEDPSPFTAAGAFAAIDAAACHAFGHGLDGVRVLVQGVGNVGYRLTTMLAEADAHVMVTDVNRDRAVDVARTVGGKVVETQDLFTTPTDVFAPCASARVLDSQTARVLQARIVAGAANDTLAAPETAEVLAQRGITYVPDFVANAGGVIHIHALRAGWSEDELHGALSGIGTRVTAILESASRTGRGPLQTAQDLAADILRATASVR